MDIVCISTIDWNSTWQRHHSFMSAIANGGHRVFFLNNTGFTCPKLVDFKRIFLKLFPKKLKFQNRVPKNITVLNPFVMPPGFPGGKYINEKGLTPLFITSLKNLGLRQNTIIYTYLPSRFSVDLIERLRPNKVVYDYVLDFFNHPNPPKELSLIHNRLLELADVVLTDSAALGKKSLANHKMVRVLHHGVADAFFKHSAGREGEKIKTLCYFGTMGPKILNYEALYLLAEEGFTLTLIGSIKGGKPKPHPNIHVVPAMEVADLAKEVSRHDAILLPYLDSPFNKMVMPAKIFQCLATGKPIVSTGLPLLEEFGERGIIYPVKSGESVSGVIEGIHRVETEARVRLRQEFASQFREADCHKSLLEFVFT